MLKAKQDAITKVRGYINADLKAEVDALLDADIGRVEWWASLDDYMINDNPKKDGQVLPSIAERLTGNEQQFLAAVKQGATYGLMWGKGVMRIGGYSGALDCKVDSKGMLKLIFKAGVYTSADRIVVFKGERFQPLPTADPPRLIHWPRYDIDRTRENVIAAYIILRGPGVPDKFLVVGREQIVAVASRGGSLYLGDDFEEMTKWIPLRKITKELDDNPKLEMAIHAAKAAWDGDYQEQPAALPPAGQSLADRAIDHGEDTPEQDAPLPSAADVAASEV